MNNSQFDISNETLTDEAWSSATIRRGETSQNLSENQLLFLPGFAHNERFFDIWNSQLANNGIESLAVNYRTNSLEPLTHAEVNKHTMATYKKAVLAFIQEAFEKTGKSQVLVHHSMASRIIYELHSENKLPQSVRGLVFLNPVPKSSAVFFSSAKALTSDWLNNLTKIPTHLKFANALVRNRVSEFLVQNPEFVFKFFFSSVPGNDDFRLSPKIDPSTFIKTYLCTESSSATKSFLAPSFSKVRKSNLPMLFIATEDDHVTPAKAVNNFFNAMNEKNPNSKSIKTSGSHETPMDKDGGEVLEAIINFASELD